jgi:adenosylmethionine-8-amino-7-oxononanoate aminotransferase
MFITHYQVYHGATSGVTGLTSVLFPLGPKMMQGKELAETAHGVYHVLPPQCYHCGYGLEYPSCDILCARVVEKVIRSMGPDNVIAFIGAPMSTPTNTIIPPKEYWQIIREICNKYGILLILDEIITGWGRVGELFASNYYNVVPDIMTTAKGLSSAYMPISATVVRDYIFEALYGQALPYYGHTSCAHPVASACALAAIDFIMENKLWENSAKVGAHIMKRLTAVKDSSRIFGDVRGVGLLIGTELVEDKQTRIPSPRLQRAFWERCFEKGLFSDRDGIVPPLIITMAEADKICDIIAESIKEVEATVKS